MDPALTDLVGFSAEKDGARDILAGTFECPPNTDPYMRLLLDAMRMPNVVTEAGIIAPLVTLDEHRSGWRKEKERTASVRTELTFSDFKAAAEHPGLAEIDQLLRHVPYSIGFSPTRYQRIVDFAMLKKAGVCAGN